MGLCTSGVCMSMKPFANVQPCPTFFEVGQAATCTSNAFVQPVQPVQPVPRTRAYVRVCVCVYVNKVGQVGQVGQSLIYCGSWSVQPLTRLDKVGQRAIS